MFIVDKSIDYINSTDKKILAVMRSSNQPLIAAADRPAEPTESFICSFQNKNKKISTYIMLSLIKSGIRVFYVGEEKEYDSKRFSELEGDALEFLESMGFTMENLSFEKLSKKEQQEITSELPIFISSETMSLPDDSADSDYISSSELSEGLEDVLEADDLENLDNLNISPEKKSDVDLEMSQAFSREEVSGQEEDLIENLEEAIEEMPELSVSDLEAVEESVEEVVEAKEEVKIQKKPENIRKIARIMASF